MVEPDVLPLDLDHPLLDGFPEKRTDGRMVVVTPDEVNLSALDPIPVPGGLFKSPLAEIPEDPQGGIDGNPGIDRVQEGVIVAAHRFLG